MPSPLHRGLQALRSPRVAILLYAVLVLLPAAVFGALLWDELRGDHERTLEEAPREVRDASSRLGTEAQRRLKSLLDTEHQRSFVEFADTVWVAQEDGGGAPVPSPVQSEARPAGVEGWFQFDSGEGLDADIQFFFGSEETPEDFDPERFKEWVQVEVVDYTSRLYSSHTQALEMLYDQEGFWVQNNQVVLSDLASIAFFTHSGARTRCAISEVNDFVTPLAGDPHRVLQEVTLHLKPGPDGRPLVFMLRDIRIPHFSHLDLASMGSPACLDGLFSNQHWVQGFWIDPDWLFDRMPGEVAESVLADRQSLLTGPPDSSNQEQWVQREWDLLENLTFTRRESRPGLGKLFVAVNIDEISRRYRTQSLWFAGLGSIMLISCILGLRLLLVRIRLSQENARRSENFVAAVTHELRTPISVVKLYGEMLRDDWVQDPAKRQAYADRIVDESNRLSLLVDRVLDKRRLEGKLSALSPGDLNQEIRTQAEIIGLVGASDVTFDLHPTLPQARYTIEGVHTVLSNLVENARKYAPVDKEHPEPILVRTLPGKRGRILLEVSDHGPGIPAQEREKVLEAFYRVGDEATRSKPGTGLGLHLCAQSMRAQRGSIQIMDRPGGGTVIRATFRRA